MDAVIDWLTKEIDKREVENSRRLKFQGDFDSFSFGYLLALKECLIKLKECAL